MMAYIREHEGGGQKILVIANYQKEPQTLPLPAAIRKVLLSNLPEVDFDEDKIQLAGYQAVAAEI